MSSSGDNVFTAGPELKDKKGSRIYYEKPSIDQIRKNRNPLNLKISDVKGENRTIECFVENLRKASEGIYYGPFPILVSGDTSEIECYFPEKWFKNLRKWDEIAKTFHKYVVTDYASKQCDLSFVPTRLQEEIGQVYIGNISVSTSNPNMLFARNTYRYLMPFKEDMENCHKAFPLQFFGYDGSYIIVPCFTSNNQYSPRGSDDDVYTIQLINPNGSVTSMRCYIPHVEYLLESQNDWEKWLRDQTSKKDMSDITKHTIACCNSTIYKKNGKKEEQLIKYIIPSQNDVENGKNNFELEILIGSNSTFATVYIGDFKSLDRKTYIGPYLIKENKIDGTHGWLNCYFEKGSIFHGKEHLIKCREQELYLEKDEFESQKNVFSGTDGQRYDTEVECFERNGKDIVFLIRTIKEYDMTRDVLSGSEI